MKSCWYCLLTMIIFFAACDSEKTTQSSQAPKNPHKSVFPHAPSNSEASLSLEDQQKLKTASGKQAEVLPLAEFTELLDSLGGLLHVFNFWSLDCTDCISNNRYLEEAQAQLGEGALWIHHVNLDDLERLADINASIRSQGLVSDCYVLQSDSLYTWPSLVQLNWDGGLPAFMLVNQPEGIRLFYQKSCVVEEFLALLQPFTLM